MKVLFITHDSFLEQEPLGIMFLSAVLKQAGHDAVAINADQVDDVAADVARISPGVVAYSVTCNSAGFALDINRRIKATFDGLSVFGGPHPTFFPEMIDEDGVDVVCRGEGEHALIELVGALEARRDITAIAGLWVKRDGRVHRNDMRPVIEDLDALPFPDHDLVADIMPLANRNGTNFVMTGRGCPFDCSYCFNHLARSLAKGRFVRRRSVDNVIAELKHLKRTRATRLFSFQDDTFTIQPSWIEEFAERYASEIGVPYTCHGRAELIDDTMAERLARSGCVMVAIGLESGNDELRQSLLAKTVSREDLLRASRALHRYGIVLLTQNLVGIPHETIGTVLETIELNRQCAPEIMQLYYYSPYPRTQLADYACAHGFFSQDRFDTVPKSLFETLPLDLEHKDDLLALTRLANPCLDFDGFHRAVRIASRLPGPLRRAAYALLQRRADALRRNGRGKDTRWRDWATYQDTRNPYEQFGADWREKTA